MALAGMIVAAFLPSGGGSAVMLTMLVASSVAEVADLKAKNDLGVLETKDYLLSGLNLISGAAGAGMMTIKLAGGGVGTAFRTLQFMELTSDGLGLICFTAEAANSIEEHRKNNPNDTQGLIRIIVLNVAMGTMQGVSLRGGMKDLKGGKVGDYSTPVSRGHFYRQRIFKRVPNR